MITSPTKAPRCLHCCTIAPVQLPSGCIANALPMHCPVFHSPKQLRHPKMEEFGGVRVASVNFIHRNHVCLASQKWSIPTSFGVNQGELRTHRILRSPAGSLGITLIEERIGSETAQGKLKVDTHMLRVSSPQGQAIPSSATSENQLT